MSYGVSLIGPFQKPDHIVTLDGRRVPYLMASRDPDSDRVSLTLDGRFGIDGTEEEVSKWVAFMVQAMAVAAGYTCFGKDSQPIRLFTGPEVHGIAAVRGDEFEIRPYEDDWKLP